MSPGWAGCQPSSSRVSTLEAGIAVFKVAFERWVSGTGQPELPQLIRASLDELKAVTAGN